MPSVIIVIISCRVHRLELLSSWNLNNSSKDTSKFLLYLLFQLFGLANLIEVFFDALPLMLLAYRGYLMLLLHHRQTYE